MSTRNILITGASSGLGLALALRIARAAGDSDTIIFINGRDEMRLAHVARKIRKLGCRCVIVAADLMQQQGLKEKISELLKGRKIGLIVHAAGMLRADTDPDVNACHVNVIGTQNLLVVLQNLLSPECHVLVISSLAALVDFPAPLQAYSLSKRRAVEVARRLKDIREGVTLTVAYPRIVETPMVEGFKTHADENIAALYNTFRWYTAEEIAAGTLKDVEKGRHTSFTTTSDRVLAFLVRNVSGFKTLVEVVLKCIVSIHRITNHKGG